MKAVLISIQPYYVFLIIAKIMGWNIGKEKTAEVRKNHPKYERWNKIAKVYCSKNKKSFSRIPKEYQPLMKQFLGKVVGEFVCDKIDDFYCASVPYVVKNNLGYGKFIDDGVYKVQGNREGVVFERNDRYIDTMLKNADLANMCLSAQEIFDYIGLGKHLYDWHISDLVIYDEPKELGEFYAEGDCDCLNCKNCAWFDKGNGYNVEDDCNLAYKGAEMHKSFKPIIRPPQSWCYVEE